MLIRKHPKKRSIPPLQLSLVQFRELCEKILGNLAPGTSCDIEFRGTDGSYITASDVDAIDPIDDTIPSIIVMPTVKAESMSGDSIELRPETVTGPNNSSTTTYMFAATGARQEWVEGVTEAIAQWFLRKQSKLFRHYNYVSVGLPLAALVCFIAALVFGLRTDPTHTNIYWSSLALPVGLPAVVATFCFIAASRSFHQSYPDFSIVVRERKSSLTLATVLAVAALLLTVIQIIVSVVRH